MHIPEKLLVREFIWCEVNNRFYKHLYQYADDRAEGPINVLLKAQSEQTNMILYLMNLFSISKPAFDEEEVRYMDEPHSLITEVIEREKELTLIYESYPYFLANFPNLSPLIHRLRYLQHEKLNELNKLKSQFQKFNHLETNERIDRDYWLEEGYELEKIASGFTFPTSIAFDDEGELFVGESGYSYGPAYAKARILNIRKDGQIQEIASGFEGPLTGIAWYKGYFYVITGGFDGKVYRVSKDGQKKVLISGLRSGADHFTSEIVFGPDNKMYFAVGTVTNSGVVGVDNEYYGWLGQRPTFHDIPARDLKLVGQNFVSDNPLTKINPNDKVSTGAFHPFGTASRRGEVVKGQLLANGVLYRANPDGSNLEIVADGFRNVFGLGFSPEGKLFATNNGFDFRGSRPIEGDWDPLYEIRPGWYGWPDFASGLPVTLPYFKPPGHPQPQFLLEQHPPLAAQPLIRFKPHAATQKFDFSKNERFGRRGEMFLAQIGSAPPITTGEQKPSGYRVVRAMPYTGQVRDFLVNLKPGKGGKGPERPVAVRFSPDGNFLYIVDFGLLGATATTAIPYADTGAIWRVKRK
ncbi:glucose/arabinose dehydrogenase [Bacillus oleivorans]|uniref:Glucose/arabinose dehydrogenase n=1 Tax=Bacillus oleivorans TaxID=1448271 RepID=A0A285CV34_9BACI|nr:glucose dehydrogenase [Bacillus oleivorans]SNX70898.1 glucose/arabinose dehydrogenase [Bacillus oleivorans]